MPSALATAQTAVWSALSAAWAADHPTVPIAWPNVQFTPPDPPTSWIRAELTFGDGFPDTMLPTGGNRVMGVLGLVINVPRDEGGAETMALADDLRSLFTRTTLGTVEFGVASGPRRVDQGAWCSTLVTVPLTVREVA